MRSARSGKLGSRGRRRGCTRGESGQSLILVVLAMTLIVAMAAFAIDVAQWHVSRHKAQVAADAGALAAANCLATKDCTSTATNGDAYKKATDYATSNGVPASDVAIGGGAVTVTTQTSAPETFAGVFGVHATVKARAVASYTSGVKAPTSVYAGDCTNATNPPTSGCTVDCTKPGVKVDTDGNTTISGAIETNGYVDISIGGDDSLGPVQSGPGVGTTCGKNSSQIKSGKASIADGPANATGFTGFPTTYSAVWTDASTNECSASSVYTGSSYTGGGNIAVSGGTSTVPSTITIGSTKNGNNLTVGSATTPVVMCASTSITITGNSPKLNDITLVAPSISTGGNSITITPDPNALADGGLSPAVAIYDTSATTLDFGTNNVNVTGAVYAPLAQIKVGGNNGGSALLEGNTVEIDGNNGGDGPSTTLTAFPGSDSLTQ